MVFIKKSPNLSCGWSHNEPTENYKENPNYFLIPPDGSSFSSGTVLNLCNEIRPDFVFTCNDWFVWKHLLGCLDLLKQPKLVSYSIIDGPFCVEAHQDVIQLIDMPVVATQYAQSKLKGINIDAPIFDTWCSFRNF